MYGPCSLDFSSRIVFLTRVVVRRQREGEAKGRLGHGYKGRAPVIKMQILWTLSPSPPHMVVGWMEALSLGRSAAGGWYPYPRPEHDLMGLVAPLCGPEQSPVRTRVLCAQISSHSSLETRMQGLLTPCLPGGHCAPG